MLVVIILVFLPMHVGNCHADIVINKTKNTTMLQNLEIGKC